MVYVVLSYFAFTSAVAHAVSEESDDQKILGLMHKYGITKCDKLILENDKPKTNWNVFVSRPSREIEKTVHTATLVQVFGTLNDTVKTENTYIQSSSGCFIHKTSTISFPGTCSENIDGNKWYVATSMNDKDYTEYKNKGGVSRLAKEIKVGNFNACIQETHLDDNSPLE